MTKPIDPKLAKNLSDAKRYMERFVGATGDFGRMLGVDPRWAHAIVKQVGNYAEIYERTMAPLGIARGPNRLWRDGGLMYAPPLR